MYALISVVIICATVIFVITRPVFPTANIKYLHEEPVEKPVEANPVGFTIDTKPVEEDKPSDKDELARTLKDMTSTVNAILSGEVDIDDLTRK